MNDSGLEQVGAALREMTGLRLDPVIGPDLAGVSARAWKRLGLDSLAALAQQLRADNRLDDEFIAELTVGETYFFRDQPHFDFVRDCVLPARRAEGRTDTFRIWSAGCSTGEEAWSLAMWCRALQLPAFDVLATDLSVKALAGARAGSYRRWSIDRCSNPLAASWLRRDGAEYRVDDALRGSVRFEYLNLASDAYPQVATGTSGLDLIFCRNVLIYLDPKTVALVYQKLFDALAVGGCLVAGPSDPPPPAHLAFRRVDSGMGFAFVRDPRAPPRQSVGPSVVQEGVVPILIKSVPGHPERSRGAPRPANPRPSTSLGMTGGSLLRSGSTPVLDLEQAERAFAEGDWAAAAFALSALEAVPAVASLHARALSNLGRHELALERASRALRDHPESIELRFLTASLLLGAGQLTSAAEELKRVLYLDPSLAMAHFTLAGTLHRLKRGDDAARAFRNAERLAAGRPPQEVVPLSDGQGAGRLAHASRAQATLCAGRAPS